jgi:hypothetical protein
MYPLAAELSEILKRSEFFAAPGAADDVIVFEALIERDPRTARLVCEPNPNFTHTTSSSD